MSIVVRTDDEPPATRVDYWQYIVTETFLPLHLRLSPDVECQGQMVVSELGAVAVSVVTGTPHEVFRTGKLIRSSDPEIYKLAFQLRGRHIGTQDGRQAALESGDFTVYDPTRPYHVACTDLFQTMIMMFPRPLLPLPPDEMRRLTGVRISGQSGTAAVASAALRRLAERVEEYEGANAVRLSNAILSLLTAALAERLDRDLLVPPDTHQHALMTRIYAYIEQRLGAPELSPTAVAGAHHISVRYLHKLFTAEGSTVAGWIRTRRLEQCRQDLTDPRQRHRPVSAIAARWGFRDPAHFGHLFRDTYGLSPGAYRTMHHDQPPNGG